MTWRQIYPPATIFSTGPGWGDGEGEREAGEEVYGEDDEGA
jgi:hypothetical protein